MTPAQKFNFYFPAWNACVRANGWRMAEGRLQLGSQSSHELAAVVGFARQRAIGAGRSFKVDDLRHGAHILALGRDKSSGDLTNAELDRVVALFALLKDANDLSARLKWDAYQRGEDPGSVARVEYFIRRVPEAYVRAVALDKFGTRQWENLTLAQKRALSMTLKNRTPGGPGGGASVLASRGSPAAAPHQSGDPDWNV